MVSAAPLVSSSSSQGMLMAVVALLVGTLLLAVALVDAFEVMLLPRRVQRRVRLVRAYFRATWHGWTAVRRLLPARAHATFLSVYGPLSMLGLIAVWAAALVTGFGALQWALAARAAQSAGGAAPSLLNAIYFSGVTFFTVGYGDVVATTRAGKVLAVIEAGTGFGLIAVVIGYLPVLYQLFTRRESHVIRLDARAGSPPTAAELLVRHAGSAQGLDSLRGILGDWEHWAAELLESHLSYPMLAYYRSQHDNESWLAALTAVLDACALLTVGLSATGAPSRSGTPGTPVGRAAPIRGSPGREFGREPSHGSSDRAGPVGELPTFQARMTFATARLAVLEMARALYGAVPPGGTDALDAVHAGGPTGERLPPRAFARLEARLRDGGLEFDAADAEPRLAALRHTYEPFVERLAARLLLPLPRWVAYDDATDNWQQSVGGSEAKQLVADAAASERRDARGKSPVETHHSR